MSPSQAPIPTPAHIADDLEFAMQILWEVIAQFEPEELESAPILEGWTPKAVVAHIAFWDDFQTRRMAAALAGDLAQTGFARPTLDNDGRALADMARPWTEIAAEAHAARERLVEFARSLPPEALGRDLVDGDRTLLLLAQLQSMVRHVHEHRRALARYCGSLARWSRPKLRALMEAQNTNLMNSIAGLTEATMLATPVCGVWSIRDVLAHVLSWNEYGVRLITGWPQPDPASISEWAWQPGDTMDSMNDRLMAARAHLNIIEIADGLATCHRKIMTAFDRFSDADLESEGYTWGRPGVLSSLFYELYLHEAEHAAQIWAYRAEEGS